MTRTFIFTEPFRKCWAAMGLHDEELKLLEDILLENPQKGDVIEGTSGARKMRIQMNGHGKRGGGRVAGRPHIAPAEQAGIEQLQSLIEKALK